MIRVGQALNTIQSQSQALMEEINIITDLFNTSCVSYSDLYENSR